MRKVYKPKKVMIFTQILSIYMHSTKQCHFKKMLSYVSLSFKTCLTTNTLILPSVPNTNTLILPSVPTINTLILPSVPTINTLILPSVPNTKKIQLKSAHYKISTSKLLNQTTMCPFSNNVSLFCSNAHNSPMFGIVSMSCRHAHTIVQCMVSLVCLADMHTL